MSPPKRVDIPEVVLDRREAGWSEKMVSWGHMLIAMAVLVGSFLTYTITNERANEKRLVQLEERYYQLAERNKEQDQQMAAALAERNVQIGRIEIKLDAIASDTVTLKVQSATMQTQLQQLARGRY